MLKNLSYNNNDIYIVTNLTRNKKRNYLVLKGRPTRRFYSMMKLKNKIRKLIG